MKGLVIVGAGHAGLRAALSAREAGFSGAITLVDADPDLPPYERPPLSKWRGGAVSAVPIASAQRIAEADLAFVASQVTGIDPKARELSLAQGQTLPYAKLLLATGARARGLEINGAGPIATLRSKANADAIHAKAQSANSALIIGAGFIGLELAASLRGRDIPVRVIEMAPQILGRGASSMVARIVQRLHQDNGVRFDLNASVNAIDVANADLCVAGIGAVPNTQLAAEAGLDVRDGIQVDQFLRSSQPGIFAAGDCCAAPIGGAHLRLEAWTAAGLQGDVAGRNMALETPTPCAFVPWVWSDQYGHVLQAAGRPDAAHMLVERSYASDHHITFGLASDGRLGFAVGIAPGVKIAKDIRFAMKLIEAGAALEPSDLSNPAIALKGLHKASL